MKNFKKTCFKAVAVLAVLAALTTGLASCKKKKGADGGPYTPPQSVSGVEGGSQ